MDEDAIEALFVAMIRSGAIDEDVIHDAAEECDVAGKEMSAHRLRCLIVAANCTSATERADRERRSRLRVVSDGGNAG